MRGDVQAPTLLLSARSLTGVSLATRDRMLEVMARFREPESLAVTLSKALDAGVDGVLASPSPALLAALAELPRPVPLYAVVPALSEHDRHELEPGLEAPLARRRALSGAASKLKLALAATLRPAFLYRGDFVARMPLLVQAELAPIDRRALRGVVLDAWLTDLALAAGHRSFFDSFCRFVRRRYHVAAGFESHNLGLLLTRLGEWDLVPDLVVGPVNPCGLMMKPSAREVLDQMTRTPVPVIAKELRAGGVNTLEQGALFARGQRARGLAVDLSELDDAGAELRALKAS